DPAGHPRAWGLTLFMGIFLNMVYWSFRLVKRRPAASGREAPAGREAPTGREAPAGRHEA
ncbi:MAG: hypothetical protein LBI86_08075, partial [Treponema sp.]|nr:hypothetical protein [Treponema sp.]